MLVDTKVDVTYAPRRFNVKDRGGRWVALVKRSNRTPVLRKKVIADFLWFAELYREDVRRRTVEGLRKARAEGKKLGRPPYPFPAEEVRRLLARGYSVAEVHRLLVLEGKVCREVGGRRECMRYETFRRRVRDILGKQKAGLGTTYRA